MPAAATTAVAPNPRSTGASPVSGDFLSVSLVPSVFFVFSSFVVGLSEPLAIAGTAAESIITAAM